MGCESPRMTDKIRNSWYYQGMRKIIGWLLLAGIPAFAACSSNDREPASDSGAVSPDSAGTVVSIDRAVPASALPKEPWMVSESGVGPVRAGMTLQEARILLPGLRTAESSDDLATAPCTYARSPSLPSGAVLMFENGRIARVDILTGSLRTAEGAGIGDTEARLQSLYQDRVVTTPHKYTDGHYMTVRSGSDSTLRIVFETDGFKVLRFRSGKTPAVEYVEGCG